jgi:D-arabinose 1-dehydrogenase
MDYSTNPRLSSVAPKLVLGGGSWSHQTDPDPESLPVRSIVHRALDAGIRAFDTSPYYGPSEALFGDALSQPLVAKEYGRQKYILMTKVGRISTAEFDYSPEWVRFSVNRSLERLKTSYLDVVFCHDIEYVSDEEVLEAVGVLFKLVEKRIIRYVGISGYPIEKLVRVSNLVRARYNRPIDAVQCWAQLTLQNTNLERYGLSNLLAAGVDCVFNSSPLGIGLLRSGGVPVGSLGDWHPAPEGLRRAVLQASDWVEEKGENLADLALRFSVSRLANIRVKSPGASTIFSVRSVSELETNLKALETLKVLLGTAGRNNVIPSEVRNFTPMNSDRLKKDKVLIAGVQQMLGEWVNFTLTSPEPGLGIQMKRMIPVTSVRGR